MKIFLDLDGVIVDWAKAAYEVHNLPLPNYNNWPLDGNDLAKMMNLSAEDFWKPYKNVEFWVNVPFFKEATGLIDHLKPFIDEGNLCFVTDHSDCPYAAAGKVKWFNKFYPGIPYSLTKHKNFYAAPDAILIDDSETNCHKFEKRGGHYVLYPSPWNRNRQHYNDRLNYCKIELREIVLNQELLNV